MFSHIMVGTNDLEKAKRFYDAVLGALGVAEGRSDHNERRRRYVYRTSTETFYITQPIDGQPATCANGGTMRFSRCSCSSACRRRGSRPAEARRNQ